MSDDNVKFYKNPNRSEQEQRKTYTPQYQIMGVEPEEYKSAIAAGPQPVVKNSSDNPRTRKSNITQAYAETTASPIGRGRGPIPNVGNNMERTWSSVDGEIIDDITVDDNHPMVDNNEFVSSVALNLPIESHEILPTLNEAIHPQKKFVSHPVTTATSNTDEVLPILYNLAEGDYLLLVNGVAVCSGPAAEIQKQAGLLVFGEHKLCDGSPIPVDDIVVIKRIAIKVGLFLE